MVRLSNVLNVLKLRGGMAMADLHLNKYSRDIPNQR